MACPDIGTNDLAEKYLCRQLEPDAEAEFELHVLECKACQDTLDLLIEVRTALAQRAHEIRPSPSVAHRVHRWIWVFAAIALVVGPLQYGFWVSHTSNERSAVGSPMPPQASLCSGGTANDCPPSPPSASLQSSVSKDAGEKQQLHSGVNRTGQNPNRDRTSKEPTTMAKLEPGVRHDTGLDQAEKSTASDNLRPVDPANEVIVAKEELSRLAEVQPPVYTFAGSTVLSEPGNNEMNHVVAEIGVPHQRTRLSQDLFRSAMLAYVDKHYADAAALLQDAVKLQPTDWEVNFFLGVCYLMLSNPLDAIPPLQIVADNRDTSIAQAGHFYLAKAYLRIEDLSKASSQIKAAAALPGRLQSQAQLLLDELNSLTMPSRKAN